MKFPKLSQWKQLFGVIRGPEKIIFISLLFLAFLSGGYLITDLYLKNTTISPAYGGVYTEGVVGQPRFINPIYGETNDIDRTLIDLVYSGLMTYDENGKIVNDLIKDYKISDDGKTYIFQLKDNLFWQDGAPLTTDDIVFTIKTIQNSDYKSPLRASWLGVEIKKISDKSFTFALNSPYNSFLENCTIKIIPQHIWKNVPVENFTLSPYNLQPIGSGPYVVSDIKEGKDNSIKSLTLIVNNKYHNKQPYISKIIFKFFNNEDELIAAANQKTIDGFSNFTLDNGNSSKKIRQGWNTKEKFGIYSFFLPRYFAVFFNTRSSKIFSDSNITMALCYSVDKKELIQRLNTTFKKNFVPVNSPILPEYFNYLPPTVIYDYDINKANELLDKAGYKFSEDKTQRLKINEKKPAFQFKNYLSVGSKGDEVAELQKCLAKLDDNFKEILKNETSGKYGKATEEAVTIFQKKYLFNIPSTGETGPSTRKKLNELCFVPQNNVLPLKFSITTINQPPMLVTADILKDYWQKVGITVEVRAVELSELKDIIKNRNYDALLYGQALGSLPDLYPFWHSTQIKDPGLNLSEYQDKNADQLLKNAREALQEEIKIEKYEKLQDVILKSAPALFLYNSDYTYWVSQKIKGINTIKIVDPAKRFQNIQNWYIKTKRVWKWK